VGDVAGHFRVACAVWIPGRIGTRRMGRAARAAGDMLRRPVGICLARSRQKEALGGCQRNFWETRVVRLGGSARRSRLPRIPDPGQPVDLRTEYGAWRQGFRALSKPWTAHGRGDDLGRNGRRVQGRWEGTSERGRCSVVHGASSPDFPSPPVEPDSQVRVRWAAGRTQIYIRR
jgi:hypothetical protein